jgi:hypothetical protein
MKKILVTVVLGVAAIAAQGAAQTAQQPSQPAAQPAQGQPPASPAQAPVIKDPAEYNAYVGAVQQKDPAAQISGLEAFLTQYPNSVMKNSALQVLMQDYQQTNNQQKTIDTATKLVAADPGNVRAMALLAYFDRMKAQGGDANAQQDLVDAKKYGQMGLDALPKFTKPDGTSDADFQKMKDQMTGIFEAAMGIADLTAKDYDDSRKELRVAADGNPTDFSVVYPLALAYVGPTPPDPKTPPDSLNAIWYAARASVVAPTPQYQQQIEKYARNQYIKYHGGDDGWTDILAKAKANSVEPTDLATTIKPAPSPDEQAHKMLQDTADAEGKLHPEKMDFAIWEFVLSNGKPDDQKAVWDGIIGKVFLLNGQIIDASPTELHIAASEDDIEAKKADVTLTLTEKLPLRLVPKPGVSMNFQGSPASYTPSPFMVTMEKGSLPDLKVAPKAPVHHKPAQ